ncbi:MAG: DUF6249 domain-containing protein [Verrucomicrobiota bacterium]
MKITLLAVSCSLVLAWSALGQSPSPALSPSTSLAAPPAAVLAPSPALATASVTPNVVAAANSDDEEGIERIVTRKLKHHFAGKHHGLTVTTDHDSDNDIGDAGALMAIPIVGIIFTTLFGAPVMIVAAIMFFSYLKSRSLHRTVRMMVEKGQEVPASLFAPPPVVRARSDMRRGVILTMIGLGLIVFLAGVNGGFAGGEWAVGVIPLLIGAGYLLVWKFENRTDKAPPLP